MVLISEAFYYVLCPYNSSYKREKKMKKVMTALKSLLNMSKNKDKGML